MNKLSFRPLIGSLGIVLCVGCTSLEEKADKLLTEASRLVRSAQEAEQTSYSDALQLYQGGLEKAETITATYPSSLLASKLAQGEARIGSYTLTALRDIAIPRAKMKAEAEASLLACALLVARTIEETTARASRVAEIIALYDDAGQHE